MRLQGLASRLQTVVLRHSASPCTPTPPNLFVPSWLCVSQVLLCGGVRGVCPASQWARSCMQASIVAGALAWLVSSAARARGDLVVALLACALGASCRQPPTACAGPSVSAPAAAWKRSGALPVPCASPAPQSCAQSLAALVPERWQSALSACCAHRIGAPSSMTGAPIKGARWRGLSRSARRRPGRARGRGGPGSGDGDATDGPAGAARTVAPKHGVGVCSHLSSACAAQEHQPAASRLA